MSNAQSVAESSRTLAALARKGGAAKEDLLAAAGFLEEYAEILRREEELALKPENGNTRWTEEEETRLAAEYKRGVPVAELSALHARTASGIVSRLLKLGLLSEDDSNGKKRWTEKEEVQLAAEYAEGLPLEEMAARHGRSMNGILGRLARLGLSE